MVVMKNYDNWCFFFLTEDIQFSAQYALSKRKIGYAHKAMLYDEQPTTFKQAWRQRERWSKGFYQVFGAKACKLLKGMWTNFSCWDILTGIFPALFISVISLLVFPICMIFGAVAGDTLGIVMAAEGMGYMVLTLYLAIFVYGVFVLMTEWKNIKMPAWKKIWRNFTFPLFMFTYLPIAVCAAFKKVEWKPIFHSAQLSASDLGLCDEKHTELAICQNSEPKTQKSEGGLNTVASDKSDSTSGGRAKRQKIKQSPALVIDNAKKISLNNKHFKQTQRQIALDKKSSRKVNSRVKIVGSSVYAQSKIAKMK